MGCSQGVAATRDQVTWRELPPEITGPVWDTSGMDFDQLLRLGIAEAQVAAVQKIRHEKVRHLYTARGLLLAALRRCGPREQILRAHLLAVLLKLGEDVSTIQACMAEADRKQAKKAPSSLAGGAFDSEALIQESTRSSRKDIKEEHWGYEEMEEGLLDAHSALDATDLQEARSSVKSVDARSPKGTGITAKAPTSPTRLSGHASNGGLPSPNRLGSDHSSSSSSLCPSDPDSLGRRITNNAQAAACAASVAGVPTNHEANGFGEGISGTRFESTEDPTSPSLLQSSHGSLAVLTPTGAPSPPYLTPATERAMPEGAPWTPWPQGGTSSFNQAVDSSLALASCGSGAAAAEGWNWPTGVTDFRRVGHARMRSNQSQGKSPTVQSQAVELDTLSLAPSLAPSGMGSLPASPFPGPSFLSPTRTPPMAPKSSVPEVASTSHSSTGRPSDRLFVKILNGVSGEEEARFSVAVNAAAAEKDFLNALDKHCQEKAGQMLSGLNWLSPVEKGRRYQRRKCDTSMVEDLLNDPSFQLRGATELLLCTVPQQPPSELPAIKVRLKDLSPTRVATGTITPVTLQLDTSQLEAGHVYTVAFTHQWSNMTYTVEATPTGSLKGVTLTVPWLMLCGNKQGQNADGLYDVHLVIDGRSRSENRKTLTVGSPESEMSSSSTAVSSAFVPIRR
mmetsp:Transcript_75604/g.179669  ORF Transcript_75604/g.179669 Transcript_75604/m.179669 type:complete len:678 (-) Transcript_75604:15-2048(-)